MFREMDERVDCNIRETLSGLCRAKLTKQFLESGYCQGCCVMCPPLYNCGEYRCFFRGTTGDNTKKGG